MKNARNLLAVLFTLSLASAAALAADAPMYTVTVDDLTNGSISIQPPLPENMQVPAGTGFTIKATPAAGYAVDCIYWIGVGNQGRMYYENAAPEWKIAIDGNKHIGASFIEQKALEGFTVKNDIVFAQPGVKKLKYDVFSPNNAKSLPCIIIIHGGGWSVNNEDVMRGLARELVRGGTYVVVSADYRWIRTGDGDTTPVTMANIIEDVYGAIVHVQEHAAEYGADPTRLAVTGDSAGGHLSAAVINFADRIGDQGFGIQNGVYQFKPTYLPKGKSTDQVRKEVVSALKAAAPSYGVFSEQALGRNAGSQGDALKAVAPQSNIPNIKDRAVPQFLLRGTVDTLIQDAAVQSYADALKAAGQRAEYVQVPGAAHAFLDWKPDARTKATFYRFGVPYAAKMKEFFDSVFYPKP
jgi:acetyl esterase